MLIRIETLRGIRDGAISVAYRRWKRPTVKAGGSLRTALGVLAIRAVERVDLGGISAAEARAAGFADRAALLAELARRSGDLYRVAFGDLTPDPRIALRESVPSPAELATLRVKLARMDARASAPWTRRVLSLIGALPEVRAGDLCAQVEQALPVFKRNVRKLKDLGLTESLEVGYRVSPRGAAVLAALTVEHPDAGAE